jgi:hypothetical protein
MIQLFPSNEFTIKTQLSESEIKQKLELLFAEGADWADKNSSQDNKIKKKHYFGFITNNHFIFFPDTPFHKYKNSIKSIDKVGWNANVSYEGIIEEKSEATEIKMLFKVRRGSKAAMTFIYLTIILQIIINYLQGHYFFLITFILLLIIAPLVIYYSNNKKFNDFEHQITDYLS